MKFKLNNFSYSNIHPTRDWAVVLTVFIVVCLLGAIYGGVVFYKFENHIAEIDFNSSSSNSDSGVSKLHKVISDYDQKSVNFQNAKNSVYNVSDPMLP